MQTFRFDIVDSTNAAAKRLLTQGRITEEAWIVAREQTAGRGTQGRTWHSPRDAGIYLSLVRLDSGAITLDTTLYTLAAGVGCAEHLSATTGTAVRLKPINDLIAGGGKLGGILTEALIEDGRLTALITGIGINVRNASRPLPANTLPATSLQGLMPARRFHALDVSALTIALVEAVRSRLTDVAEGRVDLIRRAWDEFRKDAAIE